MKLNNDGVEEVYGCERELMNIKSGTKLKTEKENENRVKNSN
jgi:hypothetical protein